ncbi:hypothetical protein ACJMK2_023051 [Sinanodonta woodiana]|uniref:SH3 domain-containing protein n=1 Tax=Sinanodonta woodiana TaxID=1069815 RepID=A0ABD3T3R6_SINWO
MAQCRAKYDYKYDAEGCIDLKIGDILTNIEKHGNGWYMGKNMSTGKVGFFPGSYVTTYTDSEPVKTLKSWKPLPSKLISANASKNGSLVSFSERAERPTGENKVITMNEMTGEMTEKIRSVCPPRPSLPALIKCVTLSSEGTGKQERSSTDNRKVNTRNKTPELLDKLSSSKEILKQTGRKLFLTDTDQNRTLKGIFGAITGVLLGGLIFLVLRYLFGYSDSEAGITAAIVTTLMSIGLAVSMLFRCVVALVIPNFFTDKGRAVILTIIFGFMLSHTVQNIKVNMEEVATSTSCIADLALDQARDLQGQLKKPLEQAAQYIGSQKDVLKQSQNEMRNGILPVKKGMTQMDEKIKNIQDATNSIQKVCDSITSTLKECLETCKNIPSSSDTYLPKQLSSETYRGLTEDCKKGCQELHDVHQSCQFITLTKELQKTVQTTEEALNSLLNVFIVNLSTTMNVTAYANSSQPLESIEKEVKEELDAKTGAFIHFIRIMEKVLSLSLLLLFLRSFWYVRNYLARDSYDNIYITKRFKDLDQERKYCGLSCVLPLKKKEKKLYIDTSSWRITLVKIGHGKFGIAQIGIHFLLCLVVLLFDYLLYYILDLIKRHGNVNIQYKGTSKFILNVEGTGFIANFYRELIQGLNINESYIGELNFTNCLPEPSMPDSLNIPVYIVLYLLAVMFVLMKECALRARRKITAYYFPRQEEARIQYLHKLIRHKRISFWKFLRQKIKSSYKENCVNEQLQLMTWLSAKMPCLARCLSQKDKICLSCEAAEAGFHDIGLMKCSGDQCNAYYCTDCYETMNKTCPLCSVGDVVHRE